MQIHNRLLFDETTSNTIEEYNNSHIRISRQEFGNKIVKENHKNKKKLCKVNGDIIELRNIQQKN